MENQTTVTEFILRGFPGHWHVRILLFLLFLFVYILTLTGNFIITAVILSDHHLHKPMYCFICNFSIAEIWYITATVPKMLSGFLIERDTISFTGCFLQFYFFFSLGATECLILTTMGYDRYLAICNPLRYSTIMNSRTYISLAAFCWITGFTINMVPIILISNLPFCGPNEINHFFCDPNSLMELSCSRSHTIEIICYTYTSILILSTFFLIMVSYLNILLAILRIPSTTGRQKAFSTCASHLTVVLIFFASVIFMYVRPTAKYPFDLDKVIGVFYAILVPLINPVIYSLRNKEVITAVKKTIWSRIVPKCLSLNQSVQ
ncbi:olfactory receptor 6N2-like [Microcaecilia unicolor]|uniref:Olfactory receptor n=1 Tax=Microcaecilia unicolor TaxID=1415580 RepID=A0A6P7WN44_9AMPH|nr:olfactory receptor 6N2-like [Microcaecilia unicolor]